MKLTIFAALAALLPALTVGKSLLGEDLPEGCEKFTVGKCDPSKDEIIATYHLPSETEGVNSLCQQVCQIQEGCNFFVYNKESEDCILFQYRYLESCAQIGGLAKPSIDECSAGIENTCDTFVQEDCTFAGNDVFHETSVTDSHSCQKLLETIGFAYNAVYFIYDSSEHKCTFFDSDEFECNSLSGPELPDLDECNASTTTARPTTTTTFTTDRPATTTTDRPATTTTSRPATTTTVRTTTTTTSRPATTTTSKPATTTTARTTTTTTSRPEITTTVRTTTTTTVSGKL